MDEQTYQTILENWAHRVEESRLIQAYLMDRVGPQHPEYVRAKAITYGYRAAIQAAEAVRATDTPAPAHGAM